jgi:hypothetical protein
MLPAISLVGFLAIGLMPGLGLLAFFQVLDPAEAAMIRESRRTPAANSVRADVMGAPRAAQFRAPQESSQLESPASAKISTISKAAVRHQFKVFNVRHKKGEVQCSR